MRKQQDTYSDLYEQGIMRLQYAESIRELRRQGFGNRAVRRIMCETFGAGYMLQGLDAKRLEALRQLKLFLAMDLELV